MNTTVEFAIARNTFIFKSRNDGHQSGQLDVKYPYQYPARILWTMTIKKKGYVEAVEIKSNSSTDDTR